MYSIKQALLKREAERHIGERIVEWKMLSSGGSTNPSFFGITESGSPFSAKYVWSTRNTIEQNKIRVILNEHSFSVLPRLIRSYYSPIAHYCFITEWIEGEPLDIECLNGDIQRMLSCVQAVCRKLRTIHSTEIASVLAHVKPRSLEKDYLSALQAINIYRISIPHFAEFKAFVDNNLRKVMNMRQGLIHFDFHIGNIIFNGNECSIIDLETICISEIWRDLVYMTEINFPQQQDFCLLFLLEYFDYNIPDEYFYVSKIFVVVYMLMLAKQNRGNGYKSYCSLAEKIYNDYDGLRICIPKWLRHSAARILRNENLLSAPLIYALSKLSVHDN